MARARTRPRPTLRDRHAEQTREVIVDALITQLGETGVFDFSYFEVARRAGVSVRTIYRHFPTRESLFEAISHRINETVGFREYPRRLDDIVALCRVLFPSFDRNATLVLAQHQTSLGQQVRTHGQKDRYAAVRAAVDHEVPELEPARREAAAAVIFTLMSSDAWRRMRDVCGLDGARSGDAVAWAIDALSRALTTEHERARKKR